MINELYCVCPECGSRDIAEDGRAGRVIGEMWLCGDCNYRGPRYEFDMEDGQREWHSTFDSVEDLE